jgi:predicted Holliday junction resolvase-like endonuclease
VIENGEYPPKDDEVQEENKILIGETVDYKLFISLLLDENMYYNDKYFTLNITNIFLDVFMLITIVLVLLSSIYIGLSKIADIKKAFHLKFDFQELIEYITQYCYLINNKSCDGYNLPKIGLIAIVFIILIAIYSLRRDIIPSIKYNSEYLDFNISKDEVEKDPKNIENMLNTIYGTKDDFLNNNDNIKQIKRTQYTYGVHRRNCFCFLCFHSNQGCFRYC